MIAFTNADLRAGAMRIVGHALDVLAIVGLLAVLLFGVLACNFITEGEPSESSSSSDDGERLPRWPYDPDASTSTSSPATSTSESSSASTTSTSSPATSEGGELDSSSESSSSDDAGESSSTSDDAGESSSSSTGNAGDCDHGLCAGGVALEPGCSECVDAVCGVDDYCCTRSWDQQCIDHANELCGGICS